MCLAWDTAGWATGIDDFVARTYNDGKGHTLPYRLFIPSGYDPAKQYPLVLYLHGAGGRGTDNLKQMTDVPRFLVFAEPAIQQKWPCFILAPQCPDDELWANMPWSGATGVGKFTSITWPMEASLALLDSLPREYPGIDASRLYVTGISMGGYGTWDAVCRSPRKFKAAVPICGGGDPTKVSQVTELKDLRLRNYHCADDPAVPVLRSREMISAMQALNGIQPRYTEFPDGGHDAYTRAYSDPSLPQWLFASAGSESEDTGGGVAQQWSVFETAYETTKQYANPFADVEVDVVFQLGDQQWIVPAFWAGGGGWTVRFAPPVRGTYKYRVQCTDKANPDLNGKERTLTVTAYAGTNPLLRHGFLRVSADKRHFEHDDGTPFFWLGDTWWKGLCQRIPWEGFQRLTADRKAKGYTVAQIIGGGPYPDEPLFDPRWSNEGGRPYGRDFACVNPAYFDYADRRIRHLIDSGMVPAIVGGWGWNRGLVSNLTLGKEKWFYRHWRYVIARYGAYPVFWIIAGEMRHADLLEVAKYVREIDPYHHPATMHPPGVPEMQSGRKALNEDALVDFDFLQTAHNDWASAPITVSQVTSSYSKTPAMPVVNGEVVYEWHKNEGRHDIQRFMFWTCMLNGAAGHTYGAGGVWQMNSETVHGSDAYETTPWSVAMHYPGSAQLGLGKKLLEEYPWWRFEPHPEWVEPHSTALSEPHAEWYDNHQKWKEHNGRWDLPYAAGIPGEVRFIYIPGNNSYQLTAPVVRQLEPDVNYRAFLFDPIWGRRFDLGRVTKTRPSSTRPANDPGPKPFAGHASPLLFADRFEEVEGPAWKDYGTASQRKDGHLVGGKGLVTILEKVNETNLMASVEANSDAEAGIILRYHDPANYLVALYSPVFKAIYLHDRKNGAYGEPLGQVAVPEVGPKMRLAAAACGAYAAMVLTDGKKTYYTPFVEVSNTTCGKTGLWLYQIGDRQLYGNFELSRAQFGPVKAGQSKPSPELADAYQPPQLPSPQDWVLVLERDKDWHPSRAATLNGKPIDDLTINGRPYEVFEHGMKPEWGYKVPQQDAFILIHPKNERKQAPLYVVLHSAGHDFLSSVQCTREVGNHDIYRSPDDFYALYLDCRRNQGDWWWGGMHLNDAALIKKNSGGNPAPVERRVMDTVKWVIEQYDINPNRVYLCGISMGGSGTFGIGLRNGDVFAAIKADVPAGIEHVAQRMYFPPQVVPEGVTFPDPPIAIDYSAQNDSWSSGHERFVKAMAERKYALYFYWGPFGHAHNNAVIEKVNDLVNSFDWLNVRKNEAYPVFANATSNNKPLWPDDLKSNSAGQLNAFFRWKCLSDTNNKLEMSLFLVTPAQLKTTFVIPKETTADVSLRRIQNGQLKPGGTFQWTFGSARGEGKADAGGVITIPGLKITAEPTTLIVSK